MTKKAVLKIIAAVVLTVTCLAGLIVSNAGLHDYDGAIQIEAAALQKLETEFPICSTFTAAVPQRSCTIRYKLFGLFTIKRVDASIIEKNYVHLGGVPLGMTVQFSGLQISGFCEIVTKDGKAAPYEGSGLQINDYVTKINGISMSSVSDVQRQLAKNKGEPMKIECRRGNESFTTELTPVIDSVSGDKRMGVYLKEGIKGIGTLTYVKQGSYRFGALGHPISRTEGNQTISGKVYPCIISGSKAGVRGNSGELIGTFTEDNPIGNLTLNNDFGVFGNLVPEAAAALPLIEVGGKETARIGNAYVYATVNDKVAERYSIEIVKTAYQAGPRDKGMIIRVTDQRLLAETGGIVQGMSGSPIVQDGRLVGAVSHVFVNDPERGYGMYIDWMLNS